jgi:hypothetical protein
VPGTIDPALLHESPEIESAMRAARFERGNQVGAWIVYRDIAGVPTNVEVDHTEAGMRWLTPR